MAISLYEGSVLSYLQTLDAASGFLEKGLAHCAEQSLDPEQLIEAKLFDDMHPLRFQIHSLALHSLGAIDAIKNGLFQPPGPRPADNYAQLQALIVDTRAALRQLTPEEIDCREGAEVVFKVRDSSRTFIAEDFLLTFSLPNFHFHAATAYGILRANGVPVGKRDFMGRLRLKE